MIPESPVPLGSATLSVCLLQTHVTAHSSILTAVINVRSNIWKYESLRLLMLSLHDATCSSIHLSSHSLHNICCSQGVNPTASAGTLRDRETQLTLVLLDFRACSNYFAETWFMFSWDYGDCITTATTSSGYEISHCCETLPRICLVSWWQEITILTWNFASWHLYSE